MLNFSDLKKAIHQQFKKMIEHKLFVTDVDKGVMWDLYLDSFDAADNPVFKERREYDCNACMQFIRAAGNVVVIINNELVSIWDVTIPGGYQQVVDAMAQLVKSQPIKEPFFHFQRSVGVDKNRQQLEIDNEDEDQDPIIVTWEHLHYRLPMAYVNKEPGSAINVARTHKEVSKRGLEEITFDAINTVLDLINLKEQPLYRGEEHNDKIIKFKEIKKEFASIRLDEKKADNFCWLLPPVATIRNSVIGTLLVDISDGVDLTKAVKKYEDKVAPQNYKRSSAVISKRMIQQAQDKITSLGLIDALPRRFAAIEDININNVLWANRDAKAAMNVFEELKQDAPVSVRGDLIEVSINDFMSGILPNINKIEVMLDNTHIPNLMSLVAPVNPDAGNMLKWDNNFSWDYKGGVTDSIREKVKRAGGKVDGFLRCSLSWFNYDDLDIHMKEPFGGKHIYYSSMRSTSSGTLDVDMNASGSNTREGVENIIYTDPSKMPEGIYELFINQYSQRESTNVGFDVEMEFAGVTHTFHYNKTVKGNVVVAKFKYSKANGIKIIESLPSTKADRQEWGLTTNRFHNVSTIMYSPNHWDNNASGNKHHFFMIEGCKNDQQARGFFNEFLRDDLNDDRKVFEVLGSKMKAEVADIQLSGLGFSSTVRNSLICKVSGNHSHMIKVLF